MAKLQVQGVQVSFYTVDENDFLSLTDMARYQNPDHSDDLIRNWVRNRNTLEFLGLWEQLNNPHFKSVEFDGIKSLAGLNSFALTPKQWIESTGAMGLVSKAGRYGGTFAHKDIAFEFASWLSVEFKLYLIKEFQRLKEEEHRTLGWDIRRNLAKINYRIHTDAIQAHLIPPTLTAIQTSQVYASEADLLNMALFGQTAATWRAANPGKKGNLRDDADMSQLVCLANLENLNAVFIAEGLSPSQRLVRLNTIAVHQMEILTKLDLRKLPVPKEKPDE